MKKGIIRLVATFFGLGFLPWIPGTWGALGGLLIYIFILRVSLFSHLAAFSIITFLGFLVCSRAEDIFKEKDAGVIVIDEVSGMLLAFLFIPFNVVYIVLGFFLFRLYDTIKPPPSDRLEKLSGSYGIMFDDLLAGFYTNLSLHAVNFILVYLRLA